MPPLRGPDNVLPEGRQMRKCGVRPDRIPDDSEKELTDSQLEALLVKGRTPMIKGFAKKDGGTFEAAVVFDSDYRTAFAFDQGGKTRKPGAAKVRK